ncbi:MAG: adenylate/guanylate cyclase domain-containing protein [Deltaproteobacteria bacterium]
MSLAEAYERLPERFLELHQRRGPWPLAAEASELLEQLVAAGSSLWRARVFLPTGHPEIFGLLVEWTCGEEVHTREYPHEIIHSPAHRASPVELAEKTGQRVRVRLERVEERERFAQLGEYVALGVTDYLCDPLFRSDERVNCLSLATRRPGGFLEEDLAGFERVRGVVGLLFELRAKNHMLSSLLATYLGQNAAARVLSGQFRRGTGEALRAAIWYCDLRGFTELSDRLPAREVVVMLDRFFENIASAIEEHGGEILKFIGDAALAVFPTGEDDGAACGRALAAAEAALAGLVRLNEARRQDGSCELAVGIALHLGEVFYGNMGGRQRLDFTVIGAAVNEVARLESMSKVLGVPLLLSDPFARALASRTGLRSLGSHRLRGVSAPQEIHTLTP